MDSKVDGERMLRLCHMNSGCTNCWNVGHLLLFFHLVSSPRHNETVHSLLSPFHTEIPENTRVMCSGICSRIVRFAAFTLPVIFRNLCVRSHTTHKDPVKTRDLSCDVYNAPRTISLNWRMISASARIVRSSLIAASFQFTHFSSCECWSAFKTPRKTVER